MLLNVSKALCVGIKSFSITRLKLDTGCAPDTSFVIVGIKSFSITRLKHGNDVSDATVAFGVGIKSFSITRLKPEYSNSSTFIWNGVGIKSFSITRLKRELAHLNQNERNDGWNQKFLDYEIETIIGLPNAAKIRVLESKVSRLRD